MKEIYIWPTEFESTSVIIATGNDLMIATHSPNKKYDQLPDNFSKLKIVATFFVLSALIYATGFFIQRKKAV